MAVLALREIDDLRLFMSKLQRLIETLSATYFGALLIFSSLETFSLLF